LLLPVFEIILLASNDHSQNNSSPGGNDASYYILIILKAILRAYFSYLLYSFYTRLNRGESLLVEYGHRKLGKMLDELKEEQKKS
jgi:hypothetical protein